MANESNSEKAPATELESLSRETSLNRYAANRKAKRRRSLIRSILIAVACVVAVGGVAAWACVSGISERLRSGLDPDVTSHLTSTEREEPFYMLLLGIDRDEARTDDAAFGSSDHAYRSDSIMLARIDPKNKKVTLVSIHRDTLVDLGENGKQKINAAYALGGASYAIEVVSDFAGVDISHYAEIDMDGLEAVVDEVGGIDVNLPIAVNDPNYTGLKLSAGKHHLDGEKAALLCRARHAYDSYGDGDLYRAANQRAVIEAVAEKVLSSDAATMARTVTTMADYVTCDLGVSDIVSLATQMRGMDPTTDVMGAMEPTTSEYVDGTWYEICDESAWKALMKRVDQGLEPYESTSDDLSLGVSATTGDDASDSSSSEDASDSSSPEDDDTDSAGQDDHTGTIAVLNSSGISGMAGTAARTLNNDGFTATAGNARMRGLSSAIVYNNGRSDLAQAVAQSLGVSVTPQQNNGSYTTAADVLVIIGTDWG